jgi:hypothetical protein
MRAQPLLAIPIVGARSTAQEQDAGDPYAVAVDGSPTVMVREPCYAALLVSCYDDETSLFAGV